MALMDKLIDAGWQPPSQEAIDKWLHEKLKEIRAPRKRPMELPVIAKFRELIENDSVVYMGFVHMFKEAVAMHPTTEVQDYDTMLMLFDHIIRSAPKFAPGNPTPGIPIYAILYSVIITDAGFCTFINPDVNRMFKAMLNDWKSYLGTKDSASVLTPDMAKGGWFSKEALDVLLKYYPEGSKFNEVFACPGTDIKNGYSLPTWDAFFARFYRDIDISRPLQGNPRDPNDTIISNAAESTVYNLATDIKAHDKFWLKGQHYSVLNMLDNANSEKYAEKFIGGTIYQAFLNTSDYHRWHSPVTGIVKKAYVVPGTYYAMSPTLRDDPRILVATQGFLSIVATRALIFIETKKHGLVCFVGVGMVEVSSCDITVKAGDSIHRGDPLGTFHFGGSTHCVVFERGTRITWDPQVIDGITSDETRHLPIRSTIGTFLPKVSPRPHLEAYSFSTIPSVGG